MAELKVIKLLNGDDIIGFIEDEEDVVDNLTDDDEEFELLPLFFVRNPMQIHKTYDEKQKTHSIYLTDWVAESGQDLFPIFKDKIITAVCPNADLEEHYYQVILTLVPREESFIEEEEHTEEEVKNKEKDKKLKRHLREYKFNDDDIQ